MKSIIVTRHVYNFGQDQEINYVVHGTHWKYVIDKEFCILEVLNNDEIIASYKHWQSVRFGDEIEKEIIV